jgi:uncharacterized damage-inducible protein DinB
MMHPAKRVDQGETGSAEWSWMPSASSMILLREPPQRDAYLQPGKEQDAVDGAGPARLDTERFAAATIASTILAVSPRTDSYTITTSITPAPCKSRDRAEMRIWHERGHTTLLAVRAEPNPSGVAKVLYGDRLRWQKRDNDQRCPSMPDAGRPHSRVALGVDDGTPREGGTPVDLLDRLLGYDRFTTERVLALCRDRPDADLDRDFDIGNRTIRRTVIHMLGAMELWTGLMSGQPPVEEARDGAIAALQARHARSHDRFDAVVREVAAAGRLDETFTDHHGVPQSYGGTILQVMAWHNVHHRSEVLHMLQRLGVPDLPDGDPQEWEHLTGRI